MARVLLQSIWLASCVAFRLDNSYLDTGKYRRVFAISDIHGDAEALIYSLYLVYKAVAGEGSVTPAEFRLRLQSAISAPDIPVTPFYTGVDIALIQMGDLLDRGRHSLLCLKIMNATEAVTGFKTITLLGNHELVPLVRDDLYDSLVHPKDDLERNASQFDRHHGPIWQHIVSGTIPMVRWGPSPSKTIPSSPQILSSTSTLFVHAGLTEEFLYRYNIITPPSGYKTPYSVPSRASVLETPISNGSVPISVESFNRMILDDLNHLSYPELSEKYVWDWSPFTTRDFGEIDLDCKSVEKMLALFDVARIVVGHLPTRAHRVRTNCDGRILLTDIGASRYLHGPDRDTAPPSPGIVVLTAESADTLNHITAVYADIEEKQFLHEPIWNDGKERIQSINRWAKSFEDSVRLVSPRSPPALPPAPSRKRPRTDDTLAISTDIAPVSPPGSSPGTLAPTPSVEIIESVHKDGYCRIDQAIVDAKSGFIINYFSAESARLTELIRDRLKSHLFPVIHDLPNNPVFARTRANPVRTNPFIYRKFLETEASMFLHCYESDVDESIVVQMSQIIDMVHSISLCVGFNSETTTTFDVLALFLFDYDGSVQLGNFSKLRTCSEADRQAEREVFESLFTE